MDESEQLWRERTDWVQGPGWPSRRQYAAWRVSGFRLLLEEMTGCVTAFPALWTQLRCRPAAFPACKASSISLAW